jgi:hypothetical protein
MPTHYPEIARIFRGLAVAVTISLILWLLIGAIAAALW